MKMEFANWQIGGAVDYNLGAILKQQRIAKPMTLQELAAKSGVSPSHLGRVERGERFPSARILRKIAQPLGFDENELFTLAGFLSPQASGVEEKGPEYNRRRLDPYVAKMLSEEPAEVQRAVIGLLAILKSVARGMNREADIIPHDLKPEAPND